MAKETFTNRFLPPLVRPFWHEELHETFALPERQATWISENPSPFAREPFRFVIVYAIDHIDDSDNAANIEFVRNNDSVTLPNIL